MEEKNTDKELLNAWLQGNERAFDEIYRRYIHRLYLYTADQVKDQELAKELVMDAMLRMWQNKEKFHSVETLGAYLYATVRNCISDHYRKKAIELGSMDNIMDEPIAEEQTDAYLINEEYRIILNKGVEQLTPQRRMVFTLKMEENLSNKEIAAHLGLSVNTVERHITDAVAFLRKYVKRQIGWVAMFILSLLFC